MQPPGVCSTDDSSLLLAPVSIAGSRLALSPIADAGLANSAASAPDGFGHSAEPSAATADDDVAAAPRKSPRDTMPPDLPKGVPRLSARLLGSP